MMSARTLVSAVSRQLRKSAGLLFIAGIGLSAWAATRLAVNWSPTIYRKTSNINVFDLSAAHKPTPEPTPTPRQGPDATLQPYRLSDNSLSQQIWQLEGFNAGVTDFVVGRAISLNAAQVVNSSRKPDYRSPDTPQELPDTRESVQTYFPKEIGRYGSDYIVVILQNKAGAPIDPSVNVSGYGSNSGSTEKLPKQVGDEKYEAYAAASLNTSTFEAKLNSVEWQPLRSSKAEWVWNIAPKGDRTVRGRQHLSTAIRVQVRDKEGKVVSEGPLWQGDAPIDIYEYWFSKDEVNVTSLISLFVGAGISVPWLFDRFKGSCKGHHTANGPSMARSTKKVMAKRQNKKRRQKT